VNNVLLVTKVLVLVRAGLLLFYLWTTCALPFYYPIGSSAVVYRYCAASTAQTNTQVEEFYLDDVFVPVLPGCIRVLSLGKGLYGVFFLLTSYCVFLIVYI